MQIRTMHPRFPVSGDQKVLPWIVCVLLADTLILSIPFHLFFTSYYSLQLSKEIGGIIHGFLRITACIFFMMKLGLFMQVRFHPFKVSAPQYLFIPLVFPMVLAIPSILNIHSNELVRNSLWITCFSIFFMALAEEVLVRGFVLSMFLKKLGEEGLMKSVLLSSSIFSAMHMINLYRWSFGQVFIQMIIAFYFGFFFAALLVKTRNLLYLGLIHGIVNIAFNLDEVLRKPSIPKYAETWQQVIKAILTPAFLLSPLFIIGYWIIKKHQKRIRMAREKSSEILSRGTIDSGKQML